MDFIEQATSIGSKLCRNAIWSGGRCTWMAPFDNFKNPQKPEREYRPLDYDFYAGCSGIGVFLSSLYTVTNDAVFKTHAEGALANSVALLKKTGNVPDGLFSGTSGVAVAVIKSGLELNNPSLTIQGIDLLKTLKPVPVDNTQTDLISGAAGTILALCYLKTELDTPINDAYVKDLGYYLVRSAKTERTGLSWKTAKNQSYNLTGLAHGTAGIASSLLKLYEIYGDDVFLQTALGAVTYENSFYSPLKQNWPDLRNISERNFNNRNFNYSNSWCHGAPGIGLSRLYFYQMLGTECFLTDIKAAVSNTINNINHIQNYSLCHGLAGNIDFLLTANQVINETKADELVNRFCNILYAEHIKDHLPVPSGLNDGAETPGLMLGLAGTGYFLLRCAEPLRINSLLLLGCRNLTLESLKLRTTKVNETLVLYT
ncbi:MAG: lanthionine synthetase LanC family protein [Bacteroidia bacterium]